MPPTPPYLLHPGELEALLQGQGEGRVVLEEEEEVLLPAHLRQESSVGSRGLPAPSCPTQLPGRVPLPVWMPLQCPGTSPA